MSLEAAIQTQWEDRASLVELLPTALLFTGRAAPETPVPYATFVVVGSTPVVRTSSGESVVDVVVRFAIQTERFADGAAISAVLVSRDEGLLGAAFEFDDSRVLDVRFVRESRQASPDGVWTFTVDLLFRVST